MSNQAKFNSIVDGQGLFQPEEWYAANHNRSTLAQDYPEIHPVSAVAQIAIFQMAQFETYMREWKHLRHWKKTTPSVPGNLEEHDPFLSAVILVRRTHGGVLERTSSLQHVFRMQYTSLVKALGEVAGDSAPNRQFDQALDLAASDTAGRVDRIYNRDPITQSQLYASLEELEMFYGLERHLHFGDLQKQSNN